MFVIVISQKRPEGQLAQLAWLGLCLTILSGCATARPGVGDPPIRGLG